MLSFTLSLQVAGGVILSLLFGGNLWWIRRAITKIDRIDAIQVQLAEHAAWQAEAEKKLESVRTLELRLEKFSVSLREAKRSMSSLVKKTKVLDGMVNDITNNVTQLRTDMDWVKGEEK